MVKKRRNALILLGLAVIVAISLIVSQGIERRDTIDVTVDEVERGTIVARVSGPGRVRAETKVQISSSLMGRIVELAVDEGDHVRRGDLLLRLEDVWYRSQVEQAGARLERARAELRTAERDLAIAEEQYPQNHISEAEYEDVVTRASTYRQAVEEARASLRAAEDQLEKTVFHAPIDGVITRLNVEEGENVVTGTMNQPGTVIMTISDMSDMEVATEIDETDIVDVEVGQRAEVDVEALADTLLTGRVTEVGNSGITAMAGTEQEITNFLVVVLLRDVHPGLKPGMTATVDIITATHEDALNVPIQSVVSRKPSELSEESEEETEAAEEPRGGRSEREEEEEIEGVFVVTEDDEALFVPVVAGIADELSIEVEGELTEGQRVMSGPYRVLRTLKNGQALEVEDNAAAESGAESGEADE
ncbi:MAG: efflux RND transporter periplasmic adaptor subunit [Candidatus Eisenbacteria bacterium]|nr:efflux RND transporter periplasmic adaptor subunit [Candidatus Eisenbacteria bacterium]